MCIVINVLLWMPTLFLYRLFATGNSRENKHHFRGHRILLKGDRQSLLRYEIISYVRKSAPFDWQVLHVPKILLTHCEKLGMKRPYRMDGAVVHALGKYHVRVK